MKFAVANSTSSETESVKPLLALKRKLPNSKPPKKRLGEWGERQAISFLVQHQYQVLACNWKTPTGELDIVALDQRSNEIVFVEVKTRTTPEFVETRRLIKYRQLRAWKKTALVFLKKHRLAKSFRFDIIYVSLTSVAHFDNITI